MTTKAKSRSAHRGAPTIRDADSLADVGPLVLSEFEDYGDEAVELVLRTAARMDRQSSYRERLVHAVRLYIRCDQVPHVVLALNKRILAAADVKRRESAAIAGMAPLCAVGIAGGKVPTHGMENARD